MRLDMVSHMKTTIHIPDSLFDEAKKVAIREKTTLKALVEEGLRKVVLERMGRGQGDFKLRPASFNLSSNSVAFEIDARRQAIVSGTRPGIGQRGEDMLDWRKRTALRFEGGRP